MKVRRGRELEIDSVRGLAILLVVLGHVLQVNLQNGQSSVDSTGYL